MNMKYFVSSANKNYEELNFDKRKNKIIIAIMNDEVFSYVSFDEEQEDEAILKTN
jgi:predicted branched-subunit amino acid permease